MGALQRLALGAATATYLLMFLGAVVRTTGSGLGCPDWPLCHGQIIPPLELTALTEYAHRLAGAIASVLVLALTGAVWAKRRHERALVAPVSVVLVLLVGQILLGAVTVLLELPPPVVALHLGVAMLILGGLVWVTVAAGQAPRLRAPAASLPPRPGLVRWTVGVAAAAYLLILTGALVRATGASWACAGFPGCNGELLPFGTSPQVDLHLTHRLLAYLVTLLVGLTLVRMSPLRHHLPALWQASVAAVCAVVVQVSIGAYTVTWGPGPLLQALHVAGASAVWVSLVTLASLAFRSRCLLGHATSAGEATPSPAPSSAMSVMQTVRAYVALTKPRIIWLLLVTTLGAMLVAAKGLPPLTLVFWTMLGGALGAGAANAINCYLDRDIDLIMARTNERPIPAGLITPGNALRFGLVLGVISFGVLTVFVNLLAAMLTMSALAFYVFVYTSWLKRTTPSNIVIGGAAGAVPPLVGWAAITGELSWLPIFLFTIIFLWTPPHFWALSLLIKREYERARIPMLPVVRGDEETRRQILLYSLFLVALTLVMVSVQLMGLFYLVVASALGGLFVYYAARLRREATNAAARRLFRYSIVYLVLLFAAMVVDRQMFL